jgi:hypothetical protein
MILYHRTYQERAAAILRDGFHDSTGRYLTDEDHTGVWFSDRPDCGMPTGDVLLEIFMSLPEAELAGYEWIEEGKGYREWLIPATVVNKYGKITVKAASASA